MSEGVALLVIRQLSIVGSGHDFNEYLQGLEPLSSCDNMAHDLWFDCVLNKVLCVTRNWLTFLTIVNCFTEVNFEEMEGIVKALLVRLTDQQLAELEMLKDQIVLVRVYKLNDHQLENSSKLIDTCAVNVQLLNQIGYDFVTKAQRAFCGEEHRVDSFEDDLLHRGEVEVLYCQLGAILDVDAQVDLLFIVILHTKDQAVVDTELVTVFLEHMDQVIQDISIEQFDILDDEDDRCL